MRFPLAGEMALAGWFAFGGSVVAALAPPAGVAAPTLDVGAYPTGPQPRWSTLADGPRLPGNARPSCDLEHLGRAVAVDDNGDIYVSGLAAESNRFFLLKFSGNGDLLWQREFDSAAEMPQVPLLFHRESGEPSVGLVVPEHLGYSVHTFSSEGVPAWSSTLVSISPESRAFDAWSAAYSTDGHLYVVGYRDYGSGFIARHSGNGAADWVRIESGVEIRGVEVAGNNGIVGWGYGLDAPTVVRYDALGSQLWLRPLTDDEGWTFDATDLEVAHADKVYLAGYACRDGDCRPALGALRSDGSWLWSQILPAGSGYEYGFRSVSVGFDALHGLLDRSSSGGRFIDVVSFKTDGESLGAQSLGPFADATGGETFVDGRGWLQFVGSVDVDGEWRPLLGSRSPAGLVQFVIPSQASLADVGSCDVAAASNRGLIVVGAKITSFPASSHLFIGAFSRSGSLTWAGHEPDMTSPGDGPSSRAGPDRKGPAVHRAPDGTFWVVGGTSSPGNSQRGRPVGWRFSADGALLGTVAPFAETAFRQWANSSVVAADSSMAMAGGANAGTRYPFVAAFSSGLAETMHYVDDAGGSGWAAAVHRAGNGDLLVAQRTFELLRISPAGELLNRVTEDSLAYVLNDSVVSEDDTVWMVGSGQAADLEVDCVIAGLSPTGGLVWSRTFGLPGVSETCSAVDARAGRIVAGGRRSEGPFLVSYDTTGAVEWSLEGATGFGKPWTSIGQVLLDSAGNTWVSGRVQSVGTPSLAKVSPSGLVLWSTGFDEETTEPPRFDLDTDGRCFALVDPSTAWPVLFGLDGSGEILWRSGLDNAYSHMRLVASGKLMLTGSRNNVHSNDLLVALVEVAGFLFADGFESGDVTGWSGGEAVND